MTELEQPFIYNKKAKVLYKETEDKYLNDPEVDQDDLQFMCQELYRHELLTVFEIENVGAIDFNELTKRIELLYPHLKDNEKVIELIQTNYIESEVTTFISLFSYDTFYIVHKLICSKHHLPLLPDSLPCSEPF